MHDEDVTKEASVVEAVREDGWGNVLTGLGRAERDKRMATSFTQEPSKQQEELDRLYHGDWVIARMCDRPAAEMVRKWIELSAGDEQDAAADVLGYMGELGAPMHFQEAITWSRLHGGGVIIMGVDDGQEMSEPVNEEGIRAVRWLHVADRWDLDPVVGSNPYGEPQQYRQNTHLELPEEEGQTLGQVIHTSRLLRFDGVPTSWRVRQANNWWHKGIIERVYDAVRDFAATMGGAAHLVTDFSQAVFKIKNLAKMLAEDKDGKVIQRLALVDMARSVARVVPVDADGEEFERKATPLAGLPDLIVRFEEHLAGALDMPIKVLFGKAVAGLGDSGNSDLEQWYNHIANEQTRLVVPQATTLARYVWRSAEGPTKGKAPEKWAVVPLPLEEMSDKETAELRSKQAQSDAIYMQNEVVTPEEIRRSRFGGVKYSLNTTLDEELEAAAEVPEAEPGEVPELEATREGVIGSEEGEGGTQKAQDTALAAGQITALLEVLKSYRVRDVTREQAIAIIQVGFLMTPEQATAVVGPELPPEPKPQPAPAFGAPPAKPGAEPGAEPAPAPGEEEIGEE